MHAPDDHIAFTGKEHRMPTTREILEALQRVEVDPEHPKDAQRSIAAVLGVPSMDDVPRPGECSAWENKQWDEWLRENGFILLDSNKHLRYEHQIITRWRPTLGLTHSDFRWSMNHAQEMRRDCRNYLNRLVDACAMLDESRELQLDDGSPANLSWDVLKETVERDQISPAALVDLLLLTGEKANQLVRAEKKAQAGKRSIAVPVIISGPTTAYGAEVLGKTLQQMQKEFGWSPTKILAEFYDWDKDDANKLLEVIKRSREFQYAEGDAAEIRRLLIEEREAAKLEKKGNQTKKAIEAAPSHPTVEALRARLAKHTTANRLAGEFEKQLMSMLETVKAVGTVPMPDEELDEIDIALRAEAVKQSELEDEIVELKEQLYQKDQDLAAIEHQHEERLAAEFKVREMVKGMADLRKQLEADVHGILTKLDNVRVAYITQDLQGISEAVLEMSSKLEALGGEPAEQRKEAV